MAVVSVKVKGPVVDVGGTNQLKANIFVLITLGTPNLGRTPLNYTLPLDTDVIVDSSDIHPIWDTVSNVWTVGIPAGTLLAVRIGTDLKVAETAQPIQVSGPTISILDLES
jgi:hypothetical protein